MYLWNFIQSLLVIHRFRLIDGLKNYFCSIFPALLKSFLDNWCECQSGLSKTKSTKSYKKDYLTAKKLHWLQCFEDEKKCENFIITKTSLSFWANMTGALGNECRPRSNCSLIRIYTVCHSACIFWTHYCMLKPYFSNFRIITLIFSGVRFFLVEPPHDKINKIPVCTAKTSLIRVFDVSPMGS